MNTIIIVLGKLISSASRFLNLGEGATWPGQIALLLNPLFIKNVLDKSRTKVVLIAGTNGKTTTGKLLQTILEKNGAKVFQNATGANLLNGIASSIVLYSSILSEINYEYAIFEVDESTLPLLLEQATPNVLILLNLFRDQLDRYGEVNIVAQKWKHALVKLPNSTMLILNADDPQIASLGQGVKAKTRLFGLDEKGSTPETLQVQDVTHCPICGKKLLFEKIYFSHLGIWKCPKCDNKRPTPTITKAPLYPIIGTYNKYNTLAAVLAAKEIGINETTITNGLQDVTPAFGRQESLILQGKRIRIFLSKNPTSLNESLRTVKELGGKHLLVLLNDRIPDGRDVSWIWDVDFEHLLTNWPHIHVSGDRAWDMALRLKYAQNNHKSSIINHTSENLQHALDSALLDTPESETLYILPTYSVMLEVRELLTGKKIL